MRQFKPYKALASINAASPAAASDLFAACAGSPGWAERMAAARPFAMLEDLYTAAELAWFSVAAIERLEDLDAFKSIEQRLDSMLEDLGSSDGVASEPVRSGNV